MRLGSEPPEGAMREVDRFRCRGRWPRMTATSLARTLALFAGVVSESLLGCSSPLPSSTAPPTLNDGLPATCNPLRVNGGECAFPFPNAIYLNPDTTTKTASA